MWKERPQKLVKIHYFYSDRLAKILYSPLPWPNWFMYRRAELIDLVRFSGLWNKGKI